MTHFVVTHHVNTMNTINHMNMIHMMNHHNTTGTVSNVMLTGWDVVIVIVGLILLFLGGVKFIDWLFNKTEEMKEPWGIIVSIVGIFSYVIVGIVVIGLLVYLI